MNTFDILRQSRVGKRYGKLVVLGWVSRKGGYSCVCDCGTVATYKTYRLNNGSSYKCAKCPRKNTGRPLLPDSIGVKRAVVQRYKQSAKKRGLQFLLSEEAAIQLLLSNCSYCGLEPSTDMRLPAHKKFRYTGIDRVDNSQGYTESNCVPCCSLCNSSKMAQTKEAWLAWVERVYLHQKKMGALING